MPEGKKPVVPAPAASAAAKEDSYSAKTHLHQPMPVTEMATVAATALPANAPEGTLPSEVRPEIVTWEKLVEAIKASGKAYNMAMIEKAYNMANDAHKGVCRRSGEPYICHPLAVARLVLDLGMDSESIAAALLHDVVEDTPTTLTDLTAAFGEEVAALVDGVTKLTKIQFSNIEELQAENLRKMLLAMSRDVRVMIIKLCDRLHNMRTGDAWPEQKRRDKARETMEVYAPIANRLGILNVKEELEDRSLHYLDPVGYEEINKMLSERAGDEFLASVSGVIKSRLEESGIEGATIKRRVKSIYGIYRKTIMQNKSFDEIYDIYAVRIILDTLAECYSTLGLIHDMYHPLPNRFKDYISTPKPNGYQSLHTTVIGHEGIPFEVQIRTRTMDEQAEYGVAAHWKYKEGLEGHDKLDERLAWVSQLLENQRVSEDSGNLLHDLKSDLLPEEVFAFTPKGDVINLPAGANCIDFAYAIHSAVGNRMVGCKVNNRIVPIDHVVATGEIIAVILGPADKDATFMRIKEDAMRNGQTKPSYNLQIGTENQFITDFALFPNPTDTLTLIPFLQSFSNRYDRMAHTVVADSGYGSEENYRFMSENGMEAYVKYNYFHMEQRPRFKPDPFKAENFYYNEEHDFCICPMGQRMRRIGTRNVKTASGYVSENARYRAVRCEGCPLRCRCFKAKGNRTIELNHRLRQYKRRTKELLCSEKGLKHRGQKCIEPEAVFVQIKNNMNYKRFRHFGKDKVFMDFAFLAIAFNIKRCVQN